MSVMLIKLLKKWFSNQNNAHDYIVSVDEERRACGSAAEADESTGTVVEKKEEISKTNLTEIGNVDSICPYCGGVLTKKPLRKTKCSHCGEYIYVRTRPIDKQRVLVTFDQASEIETQWSNFPISHIYDHIDPKEIEIVKNEYFKRKGIMLSDIDAKWSILNRALLEHSKNADWGLYRNTRLSMGSVLEHNGKTDKALRTYLEVCYIDINGPNNLGGLRDPELLKKFPPFSSEESFLAPALVTKISELSAILHLQHEHIKAVFIDAAGKLFSNLKLAITPIQAWEQFEKVYNAKPSIAVTRSPEGM